MIKYINNNSFHLLSQNLKKINTVKKLKFFYLSLFKKFKHLNSKYKFSAAFKFSYISNQIDNIDLKKTKTFFGIPFGIKDIFNTKFLKTEFGSTIFKNFFPGNNSRLVDIINAKQGIIFCKTTTAEFAVHYFPEKKTLNPFNKNHITGTSSAGSAVAVACGALPVSLATQTAGSIIRPASFCGVIGFKPSFGALDRTGVLKTSDTLDTIGLFSSDINCLKKVFTNLIQFSNEYPYSINFLKKKKINKKLNIGIISEVFNHYKFYDNNIIYDFNYFYNYYLKKFNIIKNQDFKFINQVHPHHENIYCKSLSYYFKYLGNKKKKISPIMKTMIDKGEKISVEQYLASCHAQKILTKKFELTMKHYDFLITPSTGSVAPRIGKLEKTDTCLIWTFFGAPAISLPIFFDCKDRLPFGLQIIAKRYDDFSILDFAQKIITKVR